MDMKDAMACSDEMLMRIVCASYGLCRERDLDPNDGAHAAVLLTGALRYVVALAKAHGANEEWLNERIHALFGKNPVGITQPDDPGVRRWMETFKQTWGTQVPFAFSLRDEQQPLH